MLCRLRAELCSEYKCSVINDSTLTTGTSVLKKFLYLNATWCKLHLQMYYRYNLLRGMKENIKRDSGCTLKRLMSCGSGPWGWPNSAAASQDAMLSFRCPLSGTSLSALLLPGWRALLVYTSLKGAQGVGKSHWFFAVLHSTRLQQGRRGTLLTATALCCRCRSGCSQMVPVCIGADAAPADVLLWVLSRALPQTENSSAEAAALWLRAPSTPSFQAGSWGLLRLPTSGCFMFGLKWPFSEWQLFSHMRAPEVMITLYFPANCDWAAASCFAFHLLQLNWRWKHSGPEYASTVVRPYKVLTLMGTKSNPQFPLQFIILQSALCPTPFLNQL